MWLALDASTYTGSAAVLDGDRLVAHRAVAMRGVSEERLMPAVADAVKTAGGWTRLSRVLVGGGPGSFTSLRIAAAIGKGVAAARGLELWVGSSLALLAANPALGVGEVMAMLDAMRGEVFVQCFRRDEGGRLESRGDWTRQPVRDARSGVAHPDLRVVGCLADNESERVPDARWMGALVDSGLALPVDLDRWEPSYGRLAEAQVAWEARNGRPLPGGA